MTGIAATRIGVVADDDFVVNPSMIIEGRGTGVQGDSGGYESSPWESLFAKGSYVNLSF